MLSLQIQKQFLLKYLPELLKGKLLFWTLPYMHTKYWTFPYMGINKMDITQGLTKKMDVRLSKFI